MALGGLQLQSREPDLRQFIASAEKQAIDIWKGNNELPTNHTFCDGIYARSLFIPAGWIVFGKIHKRATINICARGAIRVLTELGTRIVRAGEILVSEPGIKKVGLALEDTVWINLHPTHETDLDKIEELFIAQDYDDPELVKRLMEAA